jgi:hypothetical protein
MKLNYFILGIGLLTLLVGCEDVSSNRRKGQNHSLERSTPGLEAEANIRSAIHREKGADVISYSQEIAKTLRRNLPDSLYRIVPLMEKDDEGSSRNITTMGQIGRPLSPCGSGSSFMGISSRIVDCSQKNGARSLWEGVRHGAAGEGTWTLVSLSDDRQEIWLDGQTGMVWSDIIKKTSGVNVFNWCKASGNTENATSSEVIDCGLMNDLAHGEELCVNAFTDGIGANIKWRLPTRNDFLQADLNGSRFVLKKENTQGLWTATMRAGVTGRNEAWVYNSHDGTLFGANLTSERQVRCIGTPVR